MKIGKDVMTAKDRQKAHNDGLKRLVRITIRVTDAEKDAIIAMARNEGMTINTFFKIMLKKILGKKNG